MASELIAVGTGAANSSDITVAAGTPVTVFLKMATDVPADSAARAGIEIKTAAGTYHEIGALTGQYSAQVIDGPGTYRVTRAAGSVSFGVEQG